MRAAAASMMVALRSLISTAARAQPATAQIKWQASNDGGVSWHSHLTQPIGQGFKIRAMASWTDGPVLGLGFATASFHQIDLVGAQPTDVFDLASMQGMYAPRKGDALSMQPGTGASLGFRKIDNIHPADSVAFGQFPKMLPDGQLNPFFDASHPVRIFEIDVKAIDAPDRAMTISGTWLRTGTPIANEMRIYTTERGLAHRPAEEATQSPVTIELIVPAPGVLLLVPAGLGAIGMRRRGTRLR